MSLNEQQRATGRERLKGHYNDASLTGKKTKGRFGDSDRMRDKR